MLQWKETRHENENSVSYSYEKVWSEYRLDSTAFNQRSQHYNPFEFPCCSESFEIDEVRFGEFLLSKN